MERIDCLRLEVKGPLITRFSWLRWLILIVNLNRLRITMETHLEMKLREMMFADMLNRGGRITVMWMTPFQGLNERKTANQALESILYCFLTADAQ